MLHQQKNEKNVEIIYKIITKKLFYNSTLRRRQKKSLFYTGPTDQKKMSYSAFWFYEFVKDMLNFVKVSCEKYVLTF